GSTTLTANNTYTGGTTVNAGTLQLGNGVATGSITGADNNNGTVAFNRSDSATIPGGISRARALQQGGPGSTTLAANNTYTGATTVNGGALFVDGSIASSIITTANNGARLGGGGTVGTTLITPGGTLAPGPSSGTPGTITVAGNLAFQSGAFYLVPV